MGHGIGGHTDCNHVKIPDYRIYEVTKEKTPKLYAYQERLAREGLKDPLIRNLVWRFDHRYRFPWWMRYSCIVYGVAIGLAGFGAFVWTDKNLKCSWHLSHYELENHYKLLYQLKDDYKPKHKPDH